MESTANASSTVEERPFRAAQGAPN